MTRSAAVLSENLKILRGIRRLTQAQLGERMKVTRATINRWESDATTMTLRDIDRAAEELGATTEDLLRPLVPERLSVAAAAGLSPVKRRFLERLPAPR
jgi:transcriptional regulator with XRE-family HTH domain